MRDDGFGKSKQEDGKARQAGTSESVADHQIPEVFATDSAYQFARLRQIRSSDVRNFVPRAHW
jgi:hypothetical protein